jgi:serine/threonine-protein kinase RsbW
MRPPPSSAGPLGIELPAQPRSVASARHAVADFCVGRALDHHAVAIAVSEAVTNAVVHAYPVGVDGGIRLVATLHAASLVVKVSDHGRGMTPRIESPGMGIGLGLIAKLSDSFEIHDARNGTTLTMCFDLGA